jgi:hypothetical protein
VQSGAAVEDVGKWVQGYPFCEELSSEMLQEFPVVLRHKAKLEGFNEFKVITSQVSI